MPKEISLEDVKNAGERKPVSTADRYDSLTGSVQTFRAIGLLEAVSGEIVLRGREGERDHIIKLEHAVEKYNNTMELVHRYALYGVRGWDTLAEIADDLKHKIIEAAEQRKKLNIPVPETVNSLMSQPSDQVKK